MRCSLILIAVLLLNACSAEQLTTDDVIYAPDFTMSTGDGTRYTLSDLRGGWVIVNFWATWCGPCVEEMPVLQAISEDYAASVTLLGINQGESHEKVRNFQSELGLTFPLLVMPDAETLKNYQVISLPQTVIIEPSGEIVWRQFGPLELSSFSTMIDGLLAG